MVMLALCAGPTLGFQRAPRAAAALRLESQTTSTGAPVAAASEAPLDDSKKEAYVTVPGSFRPSIVDKARTIANVCTSGTLCTSSVMEGDEGMPFGSYVDYVLDENGWPVLLLSAQSLHTVNIKKSPLVSLFAQLPRTQSTQTTAALSRVTVMGEVVDADKEEITALKLAFTLAHPYSEQIVGTSREEKVPVEVAAVSSLSIRFLTSSFPFPSFPFPRSTQHKTTHHITPHAKPKTDSPKFTFCKIKPRKIYFSGGFGVMATWVNIDEYQLARPDVLASEVSSMLSKVNAEKQGELQLLCKHFLQIEGGVESVKLQAIDRLGIDLRVKTGDFTDEYRIAFRHSVASSEDAKSELVKLFQEAWERDNGHWQYDGIDLNDRPPVSKYAEDILRSQSQGSKTGFANGDKIGGPQS